MHDKVNKTIKLAQRPVFLDFNFSKELEISDSGTYLSRALGLKTFTLRKIHQPQSGFKT